VAGCCEHGNETFGFHKRLVLPLSASQDRIGILNEKEYGRKRSSLRSARQLRRNNTRTAGSGVFSMRTS
jgi:hypothetical protein